MSTDSRTLSTALALLLAPVALGQQDCAWEQLADGPSERALGSSTVFDDQIYVFGGFEDFLVATPRVDSFDPATNAWTSRADLPTPVTHTGFARDGRNYWIAGGFVGNHPGIVTDAVWIYDVDLDSWSPGPSLPAPRGSGGLFRIDRDLHFVGGVTVDRNTDMADHWVLDLDNPLGWTPSTPLPDPRNHFGALAMGGKGYVVGGQFRHDTNPNDVDLVHEFDPLTGWKQLASLPTARSHFESGLYVNQGQLQVAGGRSLPLNLESLPDILGYDALADSWSSIALLPEPRIGPAVKIIGSDVIVAQGGKIELTPSPQTHRRPADLGAPSHYRVNAGGDAIALGQPWCADLGAINGQSFANNNLGDVAGTFDDALYVSERTGTSAVPDRFDYAIPVSGDQFVVRLHFAEIFWGAPGGGQGGSGLRVFDVSLEGQVVLDDYDIFADVGAATAAVKTFFVDVTDGVLDMSFVASVDRPKLSAFEIMAVDDGTNYCVGAPNSTGSGASMSWSGSQSVASNTVTLEASGLPVNTLAVFLQSKSQAQIPLGGGFVCVGSPLFRLTPVVTSDPTGTVTRVLDLSNPLPLASEVLPGSTWNFQAWYRDASLATSNLSDGLSLTFLP